MGLRRRKVKRELSEKDKGKRKVKKMIE